MVSFLTPDTDVRSLCRVVFVNFVLFFTGNLMVCPVGASDQRFEALVEELTAIYDADVAVLQQMPGVRVLLP